MNGIILINKEKDYTSRDVVNIVSKKLNTKKVGHFGTLDPMATGLLVLGVGKYTKFQKVMTDEIKEYEVKVKLGIKTDSYDITGQVLEKNDDINISLDKIKESLISFVGNYNQEVPIYSAVKVNGKRLYEYARNNKEVKLPKKQVCLYQISKINLENDILSFTCVVSKGFYIRSLINDLSKKLSCLMTMYSLNRIRINDFLLKDSYSIDDIKKGDFKFYDIVKILPYKKVTTTKEIEEKINNGCFLKLNYNEDKILFVKNDLPYALYERCFDIYKILFRF